VHGSCQTVRRWKTSNHQRQGGGKRQMVAKEARKQFFFEKKNQKTFVMGYALPARCAPIAKVFCFFFSKKKRFLKPLATA
jgi:hypothetical protein